jgi:hypothetical protein
MHTRRVRLGDILDDYCPRERRITNHAVVAMIEQDIKQTRCTTCDTEHEYKAARIPPQRKKKDSTSTAYQQVLAGVTKPAAPVPSPASDATREAGAAGPERGSSEASAEPPGARATEEEGGAPPPTEEGPVHRPLIRATLPRPEGQVPGRPVPEFTIRQAGGRASRFPGGNGRGGLRRARPQGGNGGQARFGQPRSGGAPRSAGGHPFGPGGRGGQRPAHPQRPPRHSHAGHLSRSGKKRSK